MAHRDVTRAMGPRRSKERNPLDRPLAAEVRITPNVASPVIAAFVAQAPTEVINDPPSETHMNRRIRRSDFAKTIATEKINAINESQMSHLT